MTPCSLLQDNSISNAPQTPRNSSAVAVVGRAVADVPMDVTVSATSNVLLLYPGVFLGFFSIGESPIPRGGA